MPTRELAEQVTSHMSKLLVYCEDVTVMNVASGGTTHLQRWIWWYYNINSSDLFHTAYFYRTSQTWWLLRLAELWTSFNRKCVLPYSIHTNSTEIDCMCSLCLCQGRNHLWLTKLIWFYHMDTTKTCAKFWVEIISQRFSNRSSWVPLWPKTWKLWKALYWETL